MGGLAVGEKQADMFKILNETTDYLPKEKPRYLNGCWNSLRYIRSS